MMRLIAKHEVWVAKVNWRDQVFLLVDTVHPVLPPYSGVQVFHLMEGYALSFTNLSNSDPNPYQTMMNDYGEHFILED